MIERILNFVDSVGFRWLVGPIMFNQRRRLKVFVIMNIWLWTSIFLLDFTTPHSNTVILFAVSRRLAVFILKFGFFMAILNEYLILIMDRRPDSEFWIVNVAMTLISFFAIDVAGPSAVNVALSCCRDDIFSVLTGKSVLILWVFNYTYAISTLHGLTPIDYQIRQRQSNHQLHLLIWYEMDICTLMPPAAALLNPLIAPMTLDLEDWAWPWMDEIPAWISMKLSEYAAPAG